MKRFILLFCLLTFCFNCNRLANKTKEGINKGGEVVGETATEFIEGVTEGVDKTLNCEIILSDKLVAEGIDTGTYTISENTLGNNNTLTLYLIFNADFEGKLSAKAFDKNEKEIGRTTINLIGKSGEAGYYDFTFDQRTDIGFRNKIIITRL